MDLHRLAPAAIGVVGLAIALSACSLTPEPVETRLPPGFAVSSPPPAAAVPSPSVVTASPVPAQTGVSTSPPGDAPADALSCGDGGSQSVSGAEQTVRIVGTCSELTVSGSALSIDASAASIRTLRISGDRARVDAAAIDVLVLQGNDGSVRAAGAIGSIDLSGDRSTVDAGGAVSSVTVRGQDNVIRATGGVGAQTVEGRGNQIG
ncbi:hypothetical protein QE418_000039 [Microbacterium testaceum]|uniref:DUF3060 domain-containing protein n=1 Tax=Microbacterium TaxID=33882 RepID=UPI00278170C0|nr:MULTISPECIES: hypothetical protein [Microbacterium]MDQ1110591.1 hypothetical protein [Microbacterium testaceum]MDR6098865.1 hypothetical protein [Microbacterium sp. SORGH_AS_0454]